MTKNPLRWDQETITADDSRNPDSWPDPTYIFSSFPRFIDLKGKAEFWLAPGLLPFRVSPTLNLVSRLFPVLSEFSYRKRGFFVGDSRLSFGTTDVQRFRTPSLLMTDLHLCSYINLPTRSVSDIQSQIPLKTCRKNSLLKKFCNLLELARITKTPKIKDPGSS